MKHSLQYLNYIKSPKWRAKAQQARERANNKCERCGTVDQRLEVHHLTYDRLGNEGLLDLLVVCHTCHAKEDRKREANTKVQQWYSRLNGWATKRYGEHWDYYHNPYEVEEEFQRWLETKGEYY